MGLISRVSSRTYRKKRNQKKKKKNLRNQQKIKNVQRKNSSQHPRRNSPHGPLPRLPSTPPHGRLPNKHQPRIQNLRQTISRTRTPKNPKKTKHLRQSLATRMYHQKNS